MLCIVCSRPIPIPIYRDEHKLCKSCASQIKMKDNLMNNICTDSDLETVQRQLLLDLNLDEDSDYETELNYLREAKRNLVLSKEKNVQLFGPSEILKECPPVQFEKQRQIKKTDTLTQECSSGALNDPRVTSDEYVQKNYPNFRFEAQDTIKNEQKAQQSCNCNEQTKGRVNRRVTINRDIKYSLVSVKKSDESENQLLDGTKSVACRAVYRPTNKHTEPQPQFEKIQSVEKDKYDATNCETIPATNGNKNPFICPVTFCKNIIPVSDLIKHFKLNHTRVPIVPVTAGACTNLFWETKVDQLGTSQCLMLLLINQKNCKTIGDRLYTDCLPVAIITTKVKLSDLLDVECSYEDDRYFYLIWMTAMSSSLEPVYYTLTAWGGADDGRVHIVNTTQSYSIRANQNPKIVYRSGTVMILTSEQIYRLSNNNEGMVKLQVVVH